MIDYGTREELLKELKMIMAEIDQRISEAHQVENIEEERFYVRIVDMLLLLSEIVDGLDDGNFEEAVETVCADVSKKVFMGLLFGLFED